MMTADNIVAELTGSGFAFVPQNAMLGLLDQHALSGWPNFASTWENLPIDTFMADGGQYRRRRFAAYGAEGAQITPKAHQPHFQGRSFNRLNGGINRWFDPVEAAAAEDPFTVGLLTLCRQLFAFTATNAGGHREQHIELHQFRIEAASDFEGYPTPEGMHRDGVDWGCVTMVGRTNVHGAETRIEDGQGKRVASVTLTEPLDTLFFDDRRIRHGVSALRRTESARAGWRDVLVATGSTLAPASRTAVDTRQDLQAQGLTQPIPPRIEPSRSAGDGLICLTSPNKEFDGCRGVGHGFGGQDCLTGPKRR
jgi:hypothetical protein